MSTAPKACPAGAAERVASEAALAPPEPGPEHPASIEGKGRYEVETQHRGVDAGQVVEHSLEGPVEVEPVAQVGAGAEESGEDHGDQRAGDGHPELGPRPVRHAP